MGESLAGSGASVCGDSPYNEVQMCLKKKKKPPSLSSVTLLRFFFSSLEHVRVKNCEGVAAAVCDPWTTPGERITLRLKNEADCFWWAANQNV